MSEEMLKEWERHLERVRSAIEAEQRNQGDDHRENDSRQLNTPDTRAKYSPLISKNMLTKEITPIVSSKQNGPGVVGTLVEYKLFGILLYRKRMYNPNYYGLKEWEFTHRI